MAGSRKLNKRLGPISSAAKLAVRRRWSEDREIEREGGGELGDKEG